MKIQNVNNMFEKTTIIRQPLSFNWQPLEDITTFELAQALRLFIGIINGKSYYEEDLKTFPDNVLRHFKITKND